MCISSAFYGPLRLILLCLERVSVKRGGKKRKKMAPLCAQRVSYGRNFFTLSGALTVCPGGHINLVSLNKVL